MSDRTVTRCYFIGGPLDETSHDIEDTVDVYKMPEMTIKWTETDGAIDRDSYRVEQFYHVYEREGPAAGCFTHKRIEARR